MEPFEKIYLAMSGGGIRAAAYSLGVLSYLKHVELLDKVVSISTVSGGSITGIKYTQMISQDPDLSFNIFFNQVFTFLNNNEIHSNAISKLNSKSTWGQSPFKGKSKNLINAFSLVYDEFLDKKKLGDIDLENSHLKEYIFNATDLVNSHQFRFRNKGLQNKNVFGNNMVKDCIDEIDIGKIRLGDILASSSCFPGGFEPMSFPSDFIEGVKCTKNIPLMDGGIIDNQGLNQYLIRKDQECVFIIDVEDKKLKTPFDFSPLPNFIKYFKLLTGNETIYTLLVLLFNFSIIQKLFVTPINNHVIIFILGFFTSLLLIVVVIRFLILHSLKKLKQKLKLKESLKFNSDDFAIYLSNRIGSLSTIIFSTFLQNNRKTHINNLYKKVKHPVLKPLSINIYGYEKLKMNEDKSNQLVISKKLIDISTNAKNFETTLWITDDAKDRSGNIIILKELIMAGQLATCRSLFGYISEHEKNSVNEIELKGNTTRLKKDWDAFKKNPNWLFIKHKT